MTDREFLESSYVHTHFQFRTESGVELMFNAIGRWEPVAVAVAANHLQNAERVVR